MAVKIDPNVWPERHLVAHTSPKDSGVIVQARVRVSHRFPTLMALAVLTLAALVMTGVLPFVGGTLLTIVAAIYWVVGA